MRIGLRSHAPEGLPFGYIPGARRGLVFHAADPATIEAFSPRRSLRHGRAGDAVVDQGVERGRRWGRLANIAPPTATGRG